MKSKPVVLLPGRETNEYFPSFLCRTHQTVMRTCFLRKRLRPPAFHSRPQHRDNINPTTLNGRVSANSFEALTPKHLTCTGDMVRAAESIVIRFAILTERG